MEFSQNHGVEETIIISDGVAPFQMPRLANDTWRTFFFLKFSKIIFRDVRLIIIHLSGLTVLRASLGCARKRGCWEADAGSVRRRGRPRDVVFRVLRVAGRGALVQGHHNHASENK